jgi:hypothetical protein
MNAITNKSFPLMIFVLLFVGIFLPGCATLRRETFSHPQSPGGTSERRTAGDYEYYLITGPDPVVRLDAQGFVMLSVASCNRRSRIISFGPGIGFPLPVIPNFFGVVWGIAGLFSPAKTSMWIAIRFDPVESPTEQSVQFDPKLVRLRTLAGKEFTPVAVASHGYFDFCGYIRHDISDGLLEIATRDAREVQGAISATARTRIALKFPVALSSADPFVLFIDGLSADGKSIPVPPINFEKGSNWIISTGMEP